ncbi:hypothetical protein PVL29_021187 [Vitis rotundifolia]|uniref:Fe2OG dioxygenase domain-containing protein n=1 Tax=Vitis rotundifolia TaxID=103349 RepID=A0AA39DBR8_VITRO|nr:hypothetical protein PVL29_021187 [Vitis rotundifolia]
MAETGSKRRKMGEERRKADAKKTTDWPLIKPKPNLQVTHLKDSHLFTVQNFFTSAESKAFVKIAESMGFTHQGSLGPTKGEAYRDNDRIRGKVAVGLNPNIRFYRYKVGQRFGRHIDESVDLGEGKRTHYTLLIYLSGGSKQKTKGVQSNVGDSSSEPLVGGETVFYGSRNGIVAEVAPTEGMALLHIHGDMSMLHEARNVTKGIKYVFRSDVAFA